MQQSPSISVRITATASFDTCEAQVSSNYTANTVSSIAFTSWQVGETSNGQR